VAAISFSDTTAWAKRHLTSSALSTNDFRINSRLLAAPTFERVEEISLQPNLNGYPVLKRTILDGVHPYLHDWRQDWD
jgi:hypothetical protein